MPSAPRAPTPVLYKGAGPGTWWHLNNAAQTGFRASAQPASVNAMLVHIGAYSHPSPYLSVSMSFAVARQYALNGPAGIASRSQPGFVYVIDLSPLKRPPKLLDPVREISRQPQAWAAHVHNGDQVLLAEVAQTNPVLTAFSPALQLGAQLRSPAVSAELQALAFAVRDAEALVQGTIPAAAVTRRIDVW